MQEGLKRERPVPAEPLGLLTSERRAPPEPAESLAPPADQEDLSNPAQLVPELPVLTAVRGDEDQADVAPSELDTPALTRLAVRAGLTLPACQPVESIADR